MAKFKIIKITTNGAEYPNAMEDTLKYPNLVKFVEDEIEIFVILEESDSFWKANDFFYMTNITEFTTT